MWTAEHHFHQHGFEVVPNVVLLNAVLAQHTRRIRLGALIHVLTTWHPLHFACQLPTIFSLEPLGVS
jgi:alkanesulfonate monooxygenase SsuD/methylene tetrahydromethanopterin reductase-like flavin-dependent oxidoreductase (luciferase family)